MEKKIIKTNEEEMKYVSPKSKMFEIVPSTIICASGDTDEEDVEF